eukprot:gene19514-21444_t
MVMILSFSNSSSSPTNQSLIFKHFCPLLFTNKLRAQSFHLTPTFITTSKVVASILSVATLPTIIANALVIIAIYRTKSLWNISNLTLLNLLIVNLLTGLIAFPSYSVLLINVVNRDLSCGLRKTVFYIGVCFTYQSMLSVILISFERFIAILHPYRYALMFSGARVFKASLVIWLFALIALLAMLTDVVAIVGRVITSIIVIFSYLFNILVYIRIFKEVRTMSLRATVFVSMATTSTSVSPTPGSVDEATRSRGSIIQMSTRFEKVKGSQGSVSQSSTMSAKEVAKRRQDRRLMKFTAYIVSFLLLSYLCLLVYQTVPPAKNQFFKIVSSVILLFQSLLSPFLFMWQSPGISRAVCTVFKRNTTNPASNGAA